MKHLFNDLWGQLLTSAVIFFSTAAYPKFGAAVFFVYFALWAFNKSKQ